MDVLHLQGKPLPDELSDYLQLKPNGRAAPNGSGQAKEPEQSGAASVSKAPREASSSDDLRLLEVAYAHAHHWAPKTIRGLELMPFATKPQVYSALAGGLGKVWSNALRIYFDDAGLADAQSALKKIESGDPAAFADDDTFARALVAAGWNRRLPFDLVAQVLRCAQSPDDGGIYYETKNLCFRRVVHWHDVGALIALISRRSYGTFAFGGNDPAIDAHADEMRTEGTTALEPVLSEAQLQEVVDYFVRRPTYSGHTAENRLDNIQRYVGYGAEVYSFGSYSLADAVQAPHLLELSVHPKLLEIGRRHLGATPLLSKIYVHWDFPNNTHLVPGGVTIGDYHRDLNDFGMFWVYMYLSDVDVESGPHASISKSHRFDFVRQRFDAAIAAGAVFPHLDREMTVFDLFDGYGYQVPQHVKLKLFENDQKFFFGPRGTIIASNGIQLHKIHQPQRKRRLIVALRYQVSMSPRTSPERECDNVPAFVVEGRIPDNAGIRAVLRPILAWPQ